MSRAPMAGASWWDRAAPLVRVVAWVPAIVATGGLAVALAALVRAPGAGLDFTDEGLYLLSADNHQPYAGHTGWFGRYTGLLFGAVGYDIGRFRVAGVLILLVAGLILGVAVARWLSDRGVRIALPGRLAIAIGIGAAALINYSLFIRTPGYNWLTFVGAALAVAGILFALSLARPHLGVAVTGGVLLGVGVMLAFWGKGSAGIGIAALAVLAVGAVSWREPNGLRARAPVLAVAAVVVGVLVIAHFVFIADPATTVAVLARSARIVAIIDDRHSVAGAIAETFRGVASLPGDVLGATSGLVVLGAAPLLLVAIPRKRRTSASLRLAVVGLPVVVVSAVLLASGAWRGGTAHYPSVAIANAALVITATVASLLAIAILPSHDPGDAGRLRRLAVGWVVLVGVAGAYSFGTNNGFVTQTNGISVLVLTAAGAAMAIGLPPRLGVTVLGVGAAAIALLAALITSTARSEPYRMPPVDNATETITFGPHAQPLTVDPVAAAYLRQLTDAAAGACWTRGTRLLDLSWSASDAYDLDATVPEVIIPLSGHFVTGTASAQEAVRVSDPAAWADAWLLTSPDLPQIDPAAVVALAGRTFPSDYRLVTTLTSPGLGFSQELWRPVDAPPCGAG